MWTIGLLFLVVAVALDPRMNDGFRAPKLWLAEILALVSLLLLSTRLLDAGTMDLRSLRSLTQQPALRAVVPLFLVAALTVFSSEAPRISAGALASLAIGAAALVGWSLGLPRPRLRGLLAFLLVPAALLAGFGVLQFHGWFRPFDFAGMQEATRLGITSLAGGSGDLGALLAFAAVIGQAEVLRRKGSARWAVAAALGLIVYGAVITQTLTAVAALGLSSLVFWTWILPRKRRLPVLAGLVVGAVALVALVAPLRERVVSLSQQFAKGEINVVLTGRLDPWHVAVRQLQDHPLLGVGHGAFEASFAETKLDLVDEGVRFFPGQAQVMFDTAHNEVLQVGAEWGVLGLLALGWALWVVFVQIHRLPSDTGKRDRALAWAGLASLAVLSVTSFPFHLALTAYPALLFFAWVLSPDKTEDAIKGDDQTSVQSRTVRRRTAFWVLLPLLLAVLILQGMRYRNHWRAARMLRVVEHRTGQMVQTGRGNPTVLWRHVRMLQDAARLDPTDSAIPLAEGSHYRLLRRGEEAEEAYRRALSLGPRPETWLNLGAAQLLQDDEEGAQQSFLTAVQLDPRMLPQVPQPHRSRLPKRRELYNLPE